jgi:hypothetical protein
MYIGASVFVFMLRTWKISVVPEPLSDLHAAADSKEAAIVSVEADDRRTTLRQWFKYNKV